MINKSILTRILVLSCITQLTACSTLGYLVHTSSGHIELVSGRQPISRLLDNSRVSEEQKKKLNSVLRIRKFASSELALLNNKSYTTYVDLNRDYAAWVVFAAAEFSLQAESWCFLVIGCVPYRGYFEYEKAVKFANQLEEEGLEVYIAPVPAYSTLGWFSDPVLSSMLNRGETATAEYIFHELAHQQLYIKNDTGFNEAFASAVSRLGVTAWLRFEEKHTALQGYLLRAKEKQRSYKIIYALREQLSELYNLPLPTQKKRKQKQVAYQQFESAITDEITSWGKYERYKGWLLEDINNAKLNALSTYQALVPGFIALFESCNQNFYEFYRVVKNTQKLTKQQRINFLSDAKCVSVNADYEHD